MNGFGILGEGLLPHVVKYNCIHGEDICHESNVVASMFRQYLFYIASIVSCATTLHLHSDSCSGQNKNNIVLGYITLFVRLEYHENIVLRSMTGGHTKFHPEEEFGHIQKNVSTCVHVRPQYD